MPDFLLIHGAWHGGWCWARVVDTLGARGHRVFTPTLSGLGERCGLLAPSNDLSLHVEDVLAVIREQKLDSFVLCGHSYGGMVARKVLDEAAGVVSSVIYLDAYLPEDGQCGLDLRSTEANERLLESLEEGWKIPPPPAALFAVEREEDRVWVDSLLTPMALGCFQEKAHLSGTPPSGTKLHYLRTSWPNESLDRLYQKAREDGWSTARWNCGHDMMIDRPLQTADFLEAASGFTP